MLLLMVNFDHVRLDHCPVVNKTNRTELLPGSTGLKTNNYNISQNLQSSIFLSLKMRKLSREALHLLHLLEIILPGSQWGLFLIM